MSSTVPKPARLSSGPPNSAGPALSMGKTRRSIGGLSVSTNTAMPSTPKSGVLRTPSSASNFRNSTASPATGGGLPQPRAVSSINASSKTLRKSVSINSFPQPPRGEGRLTSLPPSPLSAVASSRKSKTPTTPTYQFSGSTGSLVNGSGDGRTAARSRNSDGLISIASPPQSRSSSAQDSYSTSATQYEDMEATQSRPDTSAGSRSKRESKTETKGNVVVSVRVRPDASGNEHTTDGEWMVDGRRSLISYNGKEGGDYYYGECAGKKDAENRG